MSRSRSPACSLAIRPGRRRWRRRAPMPSRRSPARRTIGLQRAPSLKTPNFLTRSRGEVRQQANGVLAAGGFLDRLGWRRLHRAWGLGRPLDRIETPGGKAVDARPRAANVGEDDGTLATLVAAEFDAFGRSRAPDDVALGHLQRDSTLDRRGSGAQRIPGRSGGSAARVWRDAGALALGTDEVFRSHWPQGEFFLAAGKREPVGAREIGSRYQ